MKFRDVAHLYIGCLCEVSAQGGEHIEPLIGVKHGTPLIGGIDIDVFAYPNFKPILVSRDGLTYEQSIHCVKLNPKYKNAVEIEFLGEADLDRWGLRLTFQGPIRKYQKLVTAPWRGETPEQFAYLLSQRVDLFNLIDDREVLDADRLEHNPYFNEPISEQKNP